MKEEEEEKGKKKFWLLGSVPFSINIRQQVSIISRAEKSSDVHTYY